MTAVLMTKPVINFTDSNGAPLAGGKVYFYVAGTSTPKNTYTDASGGTPNANPVVLDSSGSAVIFLSGSYKINLTDSTGVQQPNYPVDNITSFATGALAATVQDGSGFTIQNASDITKQLRFDLSALSPSSIVTLVPPSVNANLAATDVAQTFSGAQRASTSVLTDGATITPDFSLNNNYQVVLGGSRTLANPTNVVVGQSGALDFWQDQTGSRTLTLAWGYQTAGGNAVTLSTAGCSRDTLYYDVKVAQSSTVTITIGSPGVVTWSAHGLVTGQKIQLTTTGALPTGLSTATTYFVVVIDANTFWLASSLANAAAGTTITTSGSQSGAHTMTALTINVAAQKAFA